LPLVENAPLLYWQAVGFCLDGVQRQNRYLNNCPSSICFCVTYVLLINQHTVSQQLYIEHLNDCQAPEWGPQRKGGINYYLKLSSPCRTTVSTHL
jgi:hypothetical protein